MNKDNLNILSEMLENHEWNSYYSSNHSAWSDGKSALSAIHKFIHLNGGWSEDVLNKWNSSAPKEFKYTMEWVEKFFINKDTPYIKDMERKYGK